MKDIENLFYGRSKNTNPYHYSPLVLIIPTAENSSCLDLDTNSLSNTKPKST